MERSIITCFLVVQDKHDLFLWKAYGEVTNNNMDGSWVDICLVVPGTVHFHSNLSEPTTFLPVPTPTCLQIVISNSIHIHLDSDACRFYFLIGWVMSTLLTLPINRRTTGQVTLSKIKREVTSSEWQANKKKLFCDFVTWTQTFYFAIAE